MLKEGDMKRLEQKHFRVTKEIDKWLKDKAKETGKSENQIVNEIMQKIIESEAV